jgi:hypothetical protein
MNNIPQNVKLFTKCSTIELIVSEHITTAGEHSSKCTRPNENYLLTLNISLSLSFTGGGDKVCNNA